MRRTLRRCTRLNSARHPLRASACSSGLARWWASSRACRGSSKRECRRPDGKPAAAPSPALKDILSLSAGERDGVRASRPHSNPAAPPPMRAKLTLQLLNLLELPGLGLRGVVAVEGVAAADEAVAGAGGAVAKGAADRFGGEGPLPYRIGQYARVGEHHPAESNAIGPAITHDVLRDVRQIFLQVAVGGADQQEARRRAGLELANRIDLPGYADQRVF